MKSGGSNPALRGRAAREDLGGALAGPAPWNDIDADALGPLSPSAGWDGGVNALWAVSPRAACKGLRGGDELRGAALGGGDGDEHGTVPLHLYDFATHQQPPRPPSPLPRQPAPSLLAKVRSECVSWGCTKNITYTTGGEKRTREEQTAAALGRDDGLVGKARRKTTGGSRRNTNEEESKEMIGNYPAVRFNRGLEKVLSVLRSRSPTKDNPITRAELSEAVRKDIGDSGLREHLVGNIAGMVIEDSAEKVCRQHDTSTGRFVYWLEPLADLPRKLADPEWEHLDSKLNVLIEALHELTRTVMEMKEVVQKKSAGA